MYSHRKAEPTRKLFYFELERKSLEPRTTESEIASQLKIIFIKIRPVTVVEVLLARSRCLTKGIRTHIFDEPIPHPSVLDGCDTRVPEADKTHEKDRT